MKSKCAALAVTVGHCLLYLPIRLTCTCLPLLDVLKQTLVCGAFPLWNLELHLHLDSETSLPRRLSNSKVFTR